MLPYTISGLWKQNSFLAAIKVIVFLQILAHGHSGSYGAAATSDSEPDAIEKQWLIKELRHSIQHLRGHYPEFTSSDLYLNRWLRTYDYNLVTTAAKLEASLLWRNVTRMDTILFEDFSKFETTIGYGIEGYDKGGRPVYWSPGGQYDLRRIVIAGDSKDYLRFVFRQFEVVEYTLHELGLDQMVAIFDMTGFNVRQGGCLRCGGIMTEFVDAVESYYPSLFYKAYVVNAPSIFLTFIRLAAPFMHQPTMGAVEVYDYDKSKWSREILNQIPAGQLSEEYGGTRTGWSGRDRKAEFMKLLGKVRESVRLRRALQLTSSGQDQDEPQLHNNRHHHHHHHYRDVDGDFRKEPAVPDSLTLTPARSNANHKRGGVLNHKFLNLAILFVFLYACL